MTPSTYYDQLNRVYRIERPASAWNEYITYDDDSNVTAIVAANGVITKYTYNAMDQVATRSQNSYTESYYYDYYGRLAHKVDPNGKDTYYDYDAKSRLSKVTYTQDNTSVTYSYDELDRLTSAIDTGDAAKNVSIDYYDDNSNIAGPKSVTTGSDTLHYDYDNAGRLTTISRQSLVPDPPVVSSFSPTSGVPPVSITISGNNFNGATAVKIGSSNVSSFSVSSNTTIVAQLNSQIASGPISVTTPYGTGTSSGTFTVKSPPPPSLTITGISPSSVDGYDTVTVTGTGFSGVSSVKFVKGSTSYSAGYTVQSSSSLTAPAPNVTGVFNIQVCTSGCVTSTATVSVQKLCTTCVPEKAPSDRSQKLSEQPAASEVEAAAGDGADSANVPVVTDGVVQTALLSYTYYPDDGSLASAILKDASKGDISVSLKYNQAGELTALNYPGISGSFSYCGSGVTGCPYGYLKSATYTAGSTTLRALNFTYEASRGRLATRSESGPSVPSIATSQSHSYTNDDQLTNTTTPTAGTYHTDYDKDGNATYINRAGSTYNLVYEPGTNRMTSFGGYSETYDKNGRLTVQSGSSGTATFTYNQRDQLITLNDVPGNVNMSFVYDALGRRISKTVNGTKTTFVYSGNQVIEETTNGVTKRYLVGLGLDEVWATRAGTTDEYLLHDPYNNSVIAAIDGSSKSVKTGYGYSPFGDTFTASTSNSSSNNLRYAGREQDSNSWYYYMRGRYYIPGHHRYTMEDPLGFAGGDTNLYRYVGNNPHTDSDPSGLEGDDRGDGSGGTPYDLAPVIVIGPRSILDPNAPASFLVGTGVTIGAPGIGGGGGGNGGGGGRPFPPTSPPDMTPKQPNPSDPNGPMMPTQGVPLLLAQALGCNYGYCNEAIVKDRDPSSGKVRIRSFTPLARSIARHAASNIALICQSRRKTAKPLTLSIRFWSTFPRSFNWVTSSHGNNKLKQTNG
ncbi:YD repeat-containing protein [Gloeobacter kilaueensis JS1]|uniref:YD repeat-containing protein n=1 Tax=Gloeobacter kilaueensis (strain ATCC BAA-2537 / CCAP 1431/1 / ULC 316 / JS1) TaxID=1183438 RepID=U5QPJ3_GLOK1|nr:YD repeat-containing protein [Gloeobacter kilaueensis JS1]